MYIDDYILAIISKIDRSLQVINFTVKTDTTVVEVCDLKWVQLFNFLLVDGNNVKIVDIDSGSSKIEIETTSFSTSSKLTIPDTVFFIGSRMVTSSEWLDYSNDYNDKVPFVWLNFPSNIQKQKNRNAIFFEKWQNLTLFFVADMDRSQWISKETIDNRTKIISSWCNAFTNAVGYPYRLSDSVTEHPLPIFGVEQENGAVKDIIDGNLSAVALSFDLEILENQKCKEC